MIGLIGLIGLAASQLHLVRSDSIRAPLTTSNHQINTAMTTPPPPKRGATSVVPAFDPLLWSLQPRCLSEGCWGSSDRLWDGHHRLAPPQQSWEFIHDEGCCLESLLLNLATSKTLSSQQLLLYNKYNKTNNLAAIKFLLTSLDPALMSKTRFTLFGSSSSRQSNLRQSGMVYRFIWLHLCGEVKGSIPAKAKTLCIHVCPSQS